jgi:hypothetical protein
MPSTILMPEVVTDQSTDRRHRAWWPLWGLAAVVLIEARELGTTPEISKSDLGTLPPTIADQFIPTRRICWSPAGSLCSA